MGCPFDVFPLAFHGWGSLVARHAGAFASAAVAVLMGLGVPALPWWTPLAVFAVGVPFEAANVYGHAVAGVRLLPGYCLAFAYMIGLMVREAEWMPAVMADAYPMVGAGVVMLLWSPASIVLNAFDR